MLAIKSLLKSSKLLFVVVVGLVVVALSCTAGCQHQRVAFKVEGFGLSFGVAFAPSRVEILETNSVLTTNLSVAK